MRYATAGEPSRRTTPRHDVHQPSIKGDPLKIGVVTDDDGTAVIHAMPARSKFLQGWWTP